MPAIWVLSHPIEGRDLRSGRRINIVIPDPTLDVRYFPTFPLMLREQFRLAEGRRIVCPYQSKEE